MNKQGDREKAEQARKQREHAEKFQKGELDWKKSTIGKGEVVEWQPAGQPHHLRDFPTYSDEQVMEVAQMLYAREPFRRELWHDRARWTSLARQAFDFLDNLHEACAEIAQQRRATDTAYRRAEKRRAEVAKLPNIVPFDRAIRVITREPHTRRALSKFETLLFSMPGYFGGLTNPATKRKLRSLVRGWRKNGIPCDLLMELQIVNDNASRIAREKRQANRDREEVRKRRRKKWDAGRLEKTRDKNPSVRNLSIALERI